MLRKFTALLLVFTTFFTFNALPLKATQEISTELGMNNSEPIVTEEGDIITSQLEADGVEIKCVHNKALEEYYLYLDEEEFKLDIEFEDGNVYVYLDSQEILDTTVVKGQSELLAALAGYLTPQMVIAIKTVIVTLMAYGTAGLVYISTDLMTSVVKQVKSGSLTYSKSKSRSIPYVRAIDTIKYAKKSNATYYYPAMVASNGQVMISSQSISFAQAKLRLINGMDVFASTQWAAKSVTDAASVNGRAKGPEYHWGDGDRYIHYHPYGRKWIKNRNHMPHCWYPG